MRSKNNFRSGDGMLAVGVACLTLPCGTRTAGVMEGTIDLESGGQEWIRTIEGVSQQIYSLPRLATSVPTRKR